MLKSLPAHRAGIHSQCASDLARYPFHPFETADAGIATGIRNLFQLRANTGCDLVSIHRDIVELAPTRMNDHACDSAIAHQKIRAASDDKERMIFTSTKTNQFGKSLLRARLDPKLSRTAHAQGSVFRHGLVQ